MKLIKKATLALGLSLLLTSTVLGNTVATPSTTTSGVDSNTVMQKVLTKDVAIEAAIAMNNSLSLNAQEYNVLTEKMEAVDNISSYAYKQLAISRNQNVQKREFLIDKITADITKRYDNIVLLEMEIENLKEDIALQERVIHNLELQQKIGLATSLQLSSSKVQLESLQTNKRAKEETLKSEKANFALLTNKNLDNYTLENNITFTPLRIENISSYSQAKADTYLKYQVEFAELQQNNIFSNFITGPSYADYLNVKYTVNSATLTVEDSRDTLIQSLTTSYASLLSMEEQIHALNSQINLLKSQLKTLALQYKVGLVTKLDFDKQATNLKDLQFSLTSLINSYNNLAMVLEKPWI